MEIDGPDFTALMQIALLVDAGVTDKERTTIVGAVRDMRTAQAKALADILQGNKAPDAAQQAAVDTIRRAAGLT